MLHSCIATGVLSVPDALPLDKFGLLPVVEVEESHLHAFRCGFGNLEEFLRNSRRPHEERVSHTAVVFHEHIHEGLVGYFTLSNDGIRLKESEVFDYGLSEYSAMSSFPAVKLGRFAIASSLQGRGVGAQLLKLIEGTIIASDYMSAARLVVVDAANRPDVVSFYRKNGFEMSIWADDQARNHSARSRGKNTKPEAVKMIKDILSSH